ncbi:MAG: D-aminoacyl-tRNA deacylase [Candidatus Methanomethylicaceae archaeon]
MPSLKILLYSKLDPAGINISSHLLYELPFKEVLFGSSVAYSYDDFFLISTDSPLINISRSFPNTEWVLCLSRHKSESGMRCLTVHTPGNLCNHADFGGKPKEVAISNPALQTSLLQELRRASSDLGLEVPISVEATHHGPTGLPVPVTFIEIGSDETAWKDDLLGKAVAKAVSNSIKSSPRSNERAIGVGGGHYPEKFTRLMLDEGALIGHIIPKYAMNEGMDPTMFKVCIEKTLGKCSKAFVDWKGTPSKYKEFIRTIEGIEVVKV